MFQVPSLVHSLTRLPQVTRHISPKYLDSPDQTSFTVSHQLLNSRRSILLKFLLLNIVHSHLYEMPIYQYSPGETLTMPNYQT